MEQILKMQKQQNEKIQQYLHSLTKNIENLKETPK